MKYPVTVVVPIYKTRLEGAEERTLKHNAEMLKSHRQVLLAPEGLDVSYYAEVVPELSVVRVSPEWLGAQGIAGYNRMMLSGDFYRLFSDSEYILICQTDAWIFEDRLTAWCEKGYDYVGAPWPKRPIYDFAPIRLYMQLRKRLLGHKRLLMRQDYFGRVGNGGLSLRRVERCIQATERYPKEIEEFVSRNGMVYNEDWFWALIPKEFHYPTFEEALGFSFDSHPELCYKLAGKQLPFGCHGWYKKRNIAFWQPLIG